MSEEKARFDWLGFWVQFAFGAMLGAGLGFAGWAKSPLEGSPSNLPGILFVGGGAIVIGLIAGFYGDRFWRNIGDWFR